MGGREEGEEEREGRESLNIDFLELPPSHRTNSCMTCSVS